MTEDDSRSLWRLMQNPEFIPGFAYGCVHTSLLMVLKLSPLASHTIDHLNSALTDAIPGFRDQTTPRSPVLPIAPDLRSAVGWLFQCIHQLQSMADLPICDTGRVFATTSGELRCFIPCDARSKDALGLLVKALVVLVNVVIRRGHLAEPIAQLSHARTSLSTARSSSANVPRFVRAAIKKGLPVLDLAGSTLQIGIGRHGRWLESSFTDATSVISAGLAKDKRLAAQVLRQSGVPVPDHQTANSADQAVQIAEALGYPVVVKPADLDGGSGVAAGLVTAEEVQSAYENCCGLSPRVIVEKHIEGRDYRIVVFHDRAIWAIERVPGGVTGNGTDTIGRLLEIYNADPLRSGPKPPLGKLLLDHEALALLKRQGLELGSVPTEGEFVRLRRAANIVSGGRPVAVFDKAHPDNLDLAVRATRALRLDLAGVDLIIPDITTSWRETGAGICEVNAQPNLGQTTSEHLYGRIIDSLVEGEGRIPIVLIAGADEPRKIVDQVAALFEEKGCTVACFDGRSVRIGGEQVAEGNLLSIAAGRIMMLDQRVDAMVLCVNDVSPLFTGLAVDRYDVLVLAGANFSRVGDNAAAGSQAVVHALLPACTKAVIPLAGCSEHFAALRRADGAVWCTPVTPDRLSATLRDFLD